MEKIQEVTGLLEYQTKVAKSAPKGHGPVKVKARKLTGAESFKCPATRVTLTGVKDDYVVVLPSGLRPNTLSKSADGEKVADIVVHGKRFVVSGIVFNSTYEATKSTQSVTDKVEKDAKKAKEDDEKSKQEASDKLAKAKEEATSKAKGKADKDKKAKNAK